jgi:radical SAM protein with 4Fe4S-binding SPASM domain
MIQHGVAYFNGRFKSIKHKPLSGQIELTYQCDFKCPHCYCKGSEHMGQELTTQEINDIFDAIAKEGCLWLTLTGGDPLLRKDFKKIYLYARKKGFIVTILTNGLRLTPDLTNFFVRYPPYAIEVTLNALEDKTYSRIIGIKSVLKQVQTNILYAVKHGVKVIVKANCLKENKNKIGKIKQWVEDNIGKPADNKYNFRYGTVIFPCLNGDKTPCKCRLGLKDFKNIPDEDEDIKREYCDNIKKPFGDLKKIFAPFYPCDSWKTGFFINPFGILKFCHHTYDFSVNLREKSFRYGFYQVFPMVAKAKFKTNSICRQCNIRLFCLSCPPIAFLETGDKEKPAKYFCRIAHFIEKETYRANSKK